MQILTVAPIVRGILKESLTYFSKDAVEIGSVIMVPVRTREIPALVIEAANVTDAKTALKSSDYAVRKITHAKPRRVWTPQFINAAVAMARFSAQGLGETLLALTPAPLLSAHLDGTVGDSALPFEIQNQKFEILATQESTRMRIESYQRLIRESFVRHESVFICVPTHASALLLSRELGHGIENYTFVFHSAMTKKRLVENWEKSLAEPHAILVIGSPQYFSLPRYFKTIILEDEHVRSWKTLAKPLLDMRVFAEYYAREMRSTLVFSGPILRPEIHKRIQEGEIGEFSRLSPHARASIQTSIINPRLEEKDTKERTGKRTVEILSAQLRDNIQNAQEKGETVFLLAARKGLSPITACGDCGTIIRCPECETPLVIHKKEKDLMVFACHACGFMRAPEETEHETCPTCGGWRLEALGIGIERIQEEVKKYFPHATRFVFDGDSIKTPTHARRLITEFEKTNTEKGSGKYPGILIGTPMAIPHVSTVDHVAIVSIDSLFAIPDFRMNERIFALILALREKTIHTLLVQTRTDDTTLVEHALDGDLASFMHNEQALRKVFSYPPYGTIIKITLRGKKLEIPSEINRLKEFLSEYQPIAPNTMSRDTTKIFQRKTYAGEPKNMFRMYVILKLKEGLWVEEKLLAKLRALPPQFTVEVNPDHLL